jgi:hypothetical protein
MCASLALAFFAALIYSLRDHKQSRPAGMGGSSGRSAD